MIDLFFPCRGVGGNDETKLHLNCREDLVWVSRKSLQCSERQEGIVQGSCEISDTLLTPLFL